MLVWRPPWRAAVSASDKMSDDRDALLIALVSIGAVEAGALMESIMLHGACCSEPPTYSPTTRIAVLVDVFWARSSGPVSVRSAELDLTCSFISWFPLPMCPPRLSTVDRGLLKPLVCACVRGLLCFLVVCCAPARTAHASAHICGAGSDSSRVRSRYVCVTCKRCTAGCLGIKSVTVRAHFIQSHP